MYKKELEKYRKWFRQIDGRTIQLAFATKGPDWVITNFYVPQSWANERDPEEVFIERQSYFQHLSNYFADSVNDCTLQ